MNQKIQKSITRKPTNRRGVAEVISSLLLVVITVIGAVILTTFLDETFVSGSQSVVSSTDSTIKTIKLRAYDTRNGGDLMDSIFSLNNTNSPAVPQVLCRASCSSSPDSNPASGGSDFIVIQIENQGVKPLYLKNIYLDKIGHLWDPATSLQPVDGSSPTSAGGDYPSDGTFSLLPIDGSTIQYQDNQIQGGETVNVLIKLDTDNPNIPLGKTIRVQLNIGANSLSEFLIESGDTI